MDLANPKEASMTEEETSSVEAHEENPVASQAVATAPESSDVAEKESAATADTKQHKDVEHNWTEARRKMQELDRQIRERDDYISKLHQQHTPKQSTPEVDELDRLGDDDIITKAVAKKIAMKMAKEAAIEAIREREAETVEDRIKSKYPDFDDIVTQENIDFLKQKKPALASSLAHNPDPYAQAEALYDTLKMMGVNVGSQVAKTTLADKERAIKNSQKPQSVNAVAKQSALGNAHMFENGLTPELKKQLYKEMQDAAKRS